MCRRFGASPRAWRWQCAARATPASSSLPRAAPRPPPRPPCPSGQRRLPAHAQHAACSGAVVAPRMAACPARLRPRAGAQAPKCASCLSPCSPLPWQTTWQPPGKCLQRGRRDGNAGLIRVGRAWGKRPKRGRRMRACAAPGLRPALTDFVDAAALQVRFGSLRRADGLHCRCARLGCGRHVVAPHSEEQVANVDARPALQLGHAAGSLAHGLKVCEAQVRATRTAREVASAGCRQRPS